MDKRDAYTGSPKRTAPAPTRPPRPGALPAKQRTKLLLVDIRSGESLSEHPEIVPLLRDGWHVRRIEPRVGKNRRAQALIVLVPPGSTFKPAVTGALMPWPFQTARRMES